MNDEIEKLEDKFISGHFKKTIEDKLTYKNIIAEAIRKCMWTKGTKQFKDAVEGLEGVLYFNISGYTLKKDIDKIKDKLQIDKQKVINHYKRKYGRDFYGNKEQIDLKLDVRTWYWNTFFDELIQLLAEHNLLLDQERTIPYKRLGRLTHGETR